MEIKLNAIALKSVDYRDNDKMITLYSLERGLVGACVRGVKRQGAKLSFCAQPFCFAEYVLSEKGDRLTVTSATELESFYKIRLDLHAFYAGTCVLEYALKFAESDCEGGNTFFAIVDALKKLNYGENLPERVLADFLYAQTVASGYSLGGGDCAVCGKPAKKISQAYFDSENAEVLCEECATAGLREIRPETAAALSSVACGEAVDLSSVKYLLKFLNYYFRLKTGEYICALEELTTLP